MPTDRIEELKKKFDENPRRYFAPLANEYRKAGDLAAAIDICRSQLPQQPGHMSGHIVFGQALFENGELDEARTVFETALSLDPENLIALRHLGDIALRTGDEATARHWYERVLETDPRNEEITATLQSMAAAPAAPAAPLAPVPPAEAAPSPFAGMQEEMARFEDPNAVRLDETPAMGIEVIPAHPVEPPAEAELPEFVDLNIPVQGTQASEPAAPEAHAPEDGLLDMEGLSFGASAVPEFRTDEQESEAAASSTPPLDSLEPTQFEAPGAATESFRLEGLETSQFEAPLPEVQPERISQAFPSFEELSTSFEEQPADNSPLQNPPPPAPAFVTETMAELYLQQGFRDRAADVYRQLVAQRPGDEALRARLAALEVPETPATALPAIEAPAEPQGPTMGEFLGRIAARRPRGAGDYDSPALEAAPVQLSAPEQPLTPTGFPTLPDLPEFEEPEAPAGLPQLDPPAVEEVAAAEPASGEISALFPGQVNPADEAMASRLASAFEPVQENGSVQSAEAGHESGDQSGDVVVPTAGKPARPAETELSLDRVFREPRQSGGTRQSAGFSFDQFFSGAETPAPRAPDAAESPAAASDDIAQFNAWLQGLKNK